MDENEKAAAAIVATIARIDAIPLLLPLAYEISDMRVAILAPVAGNLWTVGALHDGSVIERAGEQLILGELLYVEVDPLSQSIVAIKKSSGTGVSMPCSISTPIHLAGGRRFGMLCALAPTTLGCDAPRVVSMLQRISATIALQADQLALVDREASAFIDERAAGQLREQFIAVLGHDLRTPLHAITMSSDALARRLTDPWGTAVASRIKANARRMAALIDDALDFARANLGGGIDVDLTEVENINSGLNMVVQEIQDAQPDCEIISQIEVGRSVLCDLGRIQQVASNLIANALTHGAAHSPIRFTARADEKDLVLEVWNSGEPIPSESLGKLFEPFWRHSASRSRNGLGLGLHICSHIVRAHGGQITVTSTRAGGTQFIARLPLSPLVVSMADLALTFDTAGIRRQEHPSKSASQ